MVMDEKDIKSDLHALKRLYALLTKDGDGTSNTATDSLDEHARLLLKNLLDAATTRVFKVHSERVAGQVEEALGQPEDSSKERHTVPKLSMSTAQGTQSCERELDSEKEGLDITLLKAKRFTPQSVQTQSVHATAPEYRMKRCRLCQRSTVKQLEYIDETHFNDVPEYSNRFTLQVNNRPDCYLWNNQEETGSSCNNKTDGSKSNKGRSTGHSVSNLNDIGGTDFSSDRMVTDIAKACNSEVEGLSEEASKAIKQIELFISDHLHLFEENSAQSPNYVVETSSVSPVPNVDMTQWDESFMTRNKLLSQLSSQSVVHQVPSVTAEGINQPDLPLKQTSKLVQPAKALFRQSTNSFMRSGDLTLGSHVSGDWKELIEECKFPTQKVKTARVQNVRVIVDKIESGNCIRSRNDFVPSRICSVQNFSIELNPNEISYRTPGWQATFSSASEIESPYQSRLVMVDESSRRRLNLQTYTPSDSSMNPNNNQKHPPNIMEETLPDKKPPQLIVCQGIHKNQLDAQHKNGNSKNTYHKTAVRTSLQHHESEGIATDSCSSNWTSQQTSNHDGDSEEYSLTDESRELNVSWSRSSESGASPMSGGTGSQFSSYTSNSSGDEVYSASTSSRKSEWYARPTYSSLQSKSKKSGPSRRIHKSNNMNHRKQSGIWKRLKDRLAIILHHHHHYHHHHHPNHDDCGNDQTRMRHDTSLQKRKGKEINFKRQDEVCGERAVEKMGKSLIHEKGRHRHFYGLMEGLLRHVWHSKPGKEAVGQSAKGKYSRKKTLNKSNWRELLQHHRRAKLPNKTRLKLGLGKSRAHLKALPKLK